MELLVVSESLRRPDALPERDLLTVFMKRTHAMTDNRTYLP